MLLSICQISDHISGPPFFTALASLIGDSTLGVQGVPYPATFAGYFEGGDPAGSVTFGQMADQIASQCPDTKLVLSGYSQGAQLVHNGAALMAPSTFARIAAVVLCKHHRCMLTSFFLTQLQLAIRSTAVHSQTFPRATSRLFASQLVSWSFISWLCFSLLTSIRPHLQRYYHRLP